MNRTHSEIWNETPLHAAARLGDLAALETALAAGGELGAQDVLGFTPLHVAAIEGHAGVAARLLAAGAAVDPRAKEGVTPLRPRAARAHQSTGARSRSSPPKPLRGGGLGSGRPRLTRTARAGPRRRAPGSRR